ncbi:phospholipase D family protein [Sphaerotilus sp.]|uniref:phospholipase D family nuclease n=1 Tax=Sphaerotilus sp. TaxID=2093942 RepID=UPI00286E14C6|nr:phospholipase D family protein [Sphaerotilus sp.]
MIRFADAWPSLLAVTGALLAVAMPTVARTDEPPAAAPVAGYQTFSPRASYRLCFTPDGDSCEKLLIESIHATRRSLRVQAYVFTSVPIAQAVKQAKERGIDVQVIVDKSQVGDKYTSATYLKNGGVPVVIDTKPAIAHNKVMIFDGRAVFTGSYNFTKSAETRNTENGVLIRDDAALVKAYLDNWNTRFAVSEPY